MTAGYSGTPLPKKLGIKDRSRVTLLSAPADFMVTLGDIPPTATIQTKWGGESDIVLIFVTKFSALHATFLRAMQMLPADGGMLWVAWPKKAAKMDTDLDENVIRDNGLAAGMVDTKVCAIDETWSGLRFNRRRSK